MKTFLVWLGEKILIFIVIAAVAYYWWWILSDALFCSGWLCDTGF